MQNIPLFGSAASLIAPPGGTVTSGYFPLQYYPAENLNYYLNAETQAIQELITVINFAGLSPSSSTNQLLASISGLLNSAFQFGTYVNKVAITQPASLATLTLGAGSLLSETASKTVNLKNSMTLQGTDSNVVDTDAIIRGSYQGLLLTYVTTSGFSMGAGIVGDSTFVSTMYLSSTLVKQNGAWVAGTNQGGLDTGAIAASTWYYVYVIKNPTSQIVDVLFSASATAPTMPSGYTLKRLVGAIKTNGSSQFIQWIMYGDGDQAWVSLTSDVADATLTTSKKTYTVTSVPAIGHSTKANIFSNAASGAIVDVYGDTNLTDTAPATGGPVVLAINSGATNNASYRISGLYMTGQSLFARSTAASTTLNVSIVSFNVRPYN